MYFFEPQIELNFSSSIPNNFCILTCKTITDKCTLVTDLSKLSQQGFLSTWFPLPTLTELILILCRHLIPNDKKQINI